VLFLRDGGTHGGEDEDGKKASGSAHQQLFILLICGRIGGAIGDASRSIGGGLRDHKWRCGN
jgi:hypothetical protein